MPQRSSAHTSSSIPSPDDDAQAARCRAACKQLLTRASSRASAAQINRSPHQQSLQSVFPIADTLTAGYRPNTRHPSRLLTFGDLSLEVFQTEPSQKLCTVSTIDPPHPKDRIRSILTAISDLPPGPLQFDERDAWFVQDWEEGHWGEDGRQAPRTDCCSAVVEHLTHTYRDDLLDTVLERDPRVGHIRLPPSLKLYVDSVRDGHDARLAAPGSEVSRVEMETRQECAAIARQVVEQSLPVFPVV
jgi:hypothetical protein